MTILLALFSAIATKMKCDDYIQAFADGKELVNTLNETNPTWQKLYEPLIPAKTQVLAVRGKNRVSRKSGQ